MIGRSNARRGARRLFAVLQNRRLNQHLLYTIIDEVGSQDNVYNIYIDIGLKVFGALFPEQ